MNQDDIKTAVEGVMSLRPKGKPSRTLDNAKRAATLQRMSELEFQKELEMIMNGEIPDYGAYFFKKFDPTKGGSKNVRFNPYSGDRKPSA
ncbi:hypothetical protein [Vibrio sp. ABG19]|uniref:hypothetical protein n=1 Tax=Vibrio sp. ABG19 TaxID=2817385 RepID=UPI00249D98B3|nr:hypothetical protein [Vibrio sp. ABG19]WGY45065.1 hypothetical protein J0X00_05015 [Vibrio sp. ABG19]